MRKYENGELKKIVCNNCGKNITVKNSIVEEGVFFADFKWGFFSKKDEREDSFDLCEKCYDEITEKFLYKINTKNYTELL